MAAPWRTVRIFISSTFRDMHAERDHMVRFVFPEIRERCARRRLHLVDVDLRWGVTEEEAERGKVLEICLDEIERCRPFFIGRQALLEQMVAYAEGEEPLPLVVVGAPGSGKSALLANFAREYAEAHPDVFVLPHFIGVSPGSTDIRRTLLRLCRELARRFGITEEIPEEYEELRKAFPKFLEQAAAHGKIVLILDALNQLDPTHHAHTLNWLPPTLPGGLRLMVSTLEGDCLDALRRRRPTPTETIVGSLELEDRQEIVRQALWDYRKRLDERPENDQMGRLLGKLESDNPLYLIVACEELRVFGEFERVTERVTSLPEEIPALFEQVLERLERDHGQELVQNALSLLACSRHGLLETEILELLRRDGEEQLPRATWARLYRSLQFYLRPPGETGEEVLDFFHEQLAKAVQLRYLASDEEEIAGHQRLARYFRRKADPTGDATWRGNYPRGLSELPYHQTRGEMWEKLEQVLCDLGFIEAKCAAGITYDLVVDYNSALTVAGLPAEVRHPVEEFGRFVRAQSYILAQNPALTFQQAANEPDATAPAQAVRHRLEAGLETRPWLRWVNKPQRGSACLMTLAGHKGGVWACAFSPDGSRILSASGDNTLKLWDAATGQELTTLEGHMGGVGACAFSPDGSRILSASGDNTLKLWEAATGQELCDYPLGAFSRAQGWSPDGACLVLGTDAGAVHLLWIENLPVGPPVVTAWQWGRRRRVFRRRSEKTVHFGCPLCRTWSEAPPSALGTDLPCPHCGKLIRLNPFTINADWRPVAEAWHGRQR